MWVKKVALFQLSKELGKGYPIGDFGQERQIKNRPIVPRAVRIERRFFQRWSDNDFETVNHEPERKTKSLITCITRGSSTYKQLRNNADGTG